LIDAFHTQQSLVDILFSGSQAAILPMSIEEGVKECVFSQNPQFRDDVKINVLITYQVQGTFFAQKEHISRFGSTQVLQVIDDVSDMFAKMTRTYKLQEVHGDE
jgi:hypothetical protein